MSPGLKALSEAVQWWRKHPYITVNVREVERDLEDRLRFATAAEETLAREAREARQTSPTQEVDSSDVS